jgi:branched-chain amino acid aminotransferase
MQISVNALPESERGHCPEQLTFGAVFSDHMFSQHYHADSGWVDAKIGPLEHLSLHPAAAVLHYSQEIFEGLKAYRRQDGGVNLFRPEANAARFNRSAERMWMPTVDADFHVDALKRLVALDERWVPAQDGASLYLRPAMIATSTKLGLGAALDYLHFIICSPVAPFFNDDLGPVSVDVSDELRRAVKGGVGEAKTGGNYAASLRASELAAVDGYRQVLWLDAIEGRYVEEVGAMNIFFVYDNSELVTPTLNGSILDGITRDSILKLAPKLGYSAREARVDINEVVADIASGKITEVFGSGTAAVVSPVGKLRYRGEISTINSNQRGPVAANLLKTLTDIQYGRAEDPFGWVCPVEG